MDDEIIPVNGKDFSIRKILGEDGWEKYTKASDKIKACARIIIMRDLYQMEKAFASCDKLINKDMSIKEIKGEIENG